MRWQEMRARGLIAIICCASAHNDVQAPQWRYNLHTSDSEAYARLLSHLFGKRMVCYSHLGR